MLEPAKDALFPIVGVGASAGGLEAFTQLLRALPAETGLGFVLVQHLDPDHESALTQILSRVTSIPVHEITNDERVEPDHIYVIPRDTNLSIAGGVLKTRPRKPMRAPHRPIDAFFESLAEDRRERAVGVVLSGTASDGTLGLEAIKAEGGITFAQDESAKYDSMPKSAVAAGCVDLVLSPAEIAKELARIAKHPYVAGRAPFIPAQGSTSPERDRASATRHETDRTPLPSGGKGRPSTGAKTARAEARLGRGQRPSPEGEPKAAKGEQDAYQKILLLLHRHAGVDFTLYKSSTIQRRIHRRVVLNRQKSLAAYAGFLRGNAKELDSLYSDVLISVTSFFRNPEAFDVLRDRVLPELFKQPGDDPLRVWVLGCSTGQEAYSIAMTFAEVADKTPRMRRVQIFATDLNEALLDKARLGLYAKSLAEDITPQRLRRFFVEEQGGYRVTKMLREMVVFARQNLISDPPFSRMDLISCRNLLIYLEPSLQKKAIPTFHYALRPGGFLILGASESIAGFTHLFEAVDKKRKVYSKKPFASHALHLPEKREGGERAPGPPPSLSVRRRVGQALPEPFQDELDAQKEADRLTVTKFAPPGVLVNAELQVLQFRGPTGAFLQPPVGKASFDVLKMAREGLMLPLRSAIEEARRNNQTARKENARVKRNGRTRTVDLQVIPLKSVRERCFLILFEDSERAGGRREPPEPQPPDRSTGREDRNSRELEAELAETREYIQSIQERHEAGSEELQAANEEMQSANEELQSLNEELETSKEELESANEELTTLNEEMLNRNVELTRLNSDLVNLQTSCKLAIVLVGRDLTLRSFSPQAEKQLELQNADIGRPIGHIRHGLVGIGRGPELAANGRTRSPAPRELQILDLESLVAQAIAEVREQELEVLDKSGRWHSLRVRPYMTFDNKVDGAVLVLSDIDALKRSEHAIAAARDYAESTIDTVREPLVVLDGDLRVESANRSFYGAFGAEPAETVGKLIFDLGGRRWDIPRLRALLEEIPSKNTIIEGFEVEQDFEGLGRRSMLLNARRIQGPKPEGQRILLAIEDVTERKRLDDELRQHGAELLEADQRKNEFLAMLGHELRNPMSALTLGLDLLGKVPDDRARSEDLRRMMTRQAQRIGALLDQLLDVTRVISGKVELSKQPIDPMEPVRAAVESVGSLLAARKQELTLSLPSETNALVSGDAMRLTQVVENLLTNAAKYTPEGGQITLAFESDEDEARIIVRDNGTGMSADFLPHAFELFTQAPRTLDRAKGGLGLGLPLVRRLVEMHGGRVEASSAGPDRGSEFVVRLPRVPERRTEKRPQGGPPPSQPIRPQRILVVDDEVDTAAALAELLAEDGHRTLAVHDGPAALVAARTFDPDVVLLDLGLPELDGYEVASRLRAENPGRRILLVALTGYQADSDRLKKAGFDQHVIKPPSHEKLSALLAPSDSGKASA